MQQKLLDGDTIFSYFDAYKQELQRALNACDKSKLQLMYEKILSTAKSNNTIFVAGNGGSAAISEHLTCDWMKGTECKPHNYIRVISLVSNIALLTAMANDTGWENSISKQFELLAQKNDILLLISSSGNSVNIIQAAETAKKMGIFVLGLCGFSGGKLLEIADIAVHIPVHNYGIVEDSHQAIMHSIAQLIFKQRTFK